MSSIPAVNPVIPFLGVIPGGFGVARLVRIKGQMRYGGNRFIVNLQKTPSLIDTDTISLHLSVRPSECTIVRNHKVYKQWAQEERDGGCPIQPGSSFEILIYADYAYYKIAINGVHFTTFNHRIPMDGNTNFVAIEGDCVISYIGLEGSIQSTTYMHQPAPMYPVHQPAPMYPAEQVVHHHHYETSEPQHDSSGAMLAVAAGIGAASLGVYAASKLADSHSDSHTYTSYSYSETVSYDNSSSSDSD